MAKKKTTEAIQEVMEEKEALPSFFTNLFSSASNPLPNRAVLEYNIMHSAPVKANTEENGRGHQAPAALHHTQRAAQG